MALDQLRYMRHPLLAACMLAFPATLATVASSGAAPVTSGTLTVTGAVHGTYKLVASRQCIVNVLPATKTPNLALYFGSRSTSGVYGNPEVAISQVVKGSTKSVNLKTTKKFAVEFQSSAGAVWLSGWGTVTTAVVFVHNGAGSLSMSPNAMSGTLSTDMVRVTGKIKGTVHVTMSWKCAS